jgi:hypothetical protein
MKFTLPTDSQERKDIQLRAGCYNYFPGALMGVAMWSKRGNDKHNPGEPLHHARGKSMDHEECIERHGSDLADLQAAYDRSGDACERIGLIQAMRSFARNTVWYRWRRVPNSRLLSTRCCTSGRISLRALYRRTSPDALTPVAGAKTSDFLLMLFYP